MCGCVCVRVCVCVCVCVCACVTSTCTKKSGWQDPMQIIGPPITQHIGQNTALISGYVRKV